VGVLRWTRPIIKDELLKGKTINGKNYRA
jgi:hypothetical protein